MPKYDFSCGACGWEGERQCLMAERESLPCRCGAVLTALFSPPTTVYVPKAFGYAFSDLFGTSSEREYHKANPDLIHINKSDHSQHSAREERRKRSDAADKVVTETEAAIRANRTLAAPRVKRKRKGKSRGV